MNVAHPDNQSMNLIPLFSEERVDIKKIFEQLYRHIWIIVAAAVCTGIVEFLYTLTIQPQFQTSALLLMHSKQKNSNMLDQFNFKSNSDSVLDLEEALIKTRYILEPVILQTNLNILASPHYFPYFGAWMARRYEGSGLAKPFLGFNSYAWGGEKIEVKQFNVSKEYIGQTFKLVVGKAGNYKLYSNEGKLVLIGEVGKQAVSPNGKLNLELTTLNARPGTEFFISYQLPISLVDGLAKSLQLTDIYANNRVQVTGIFQLKITDSDPERAVRVLNTVVNYAVTKNAQQNIQEAQTSIEFLKKRLPELKDNLKDAEDSLNQYHIKNSTIDMNIIGQLLEHKMLALESGIELVKSQREDLLQVFTPQHPLIIASYDKEAKLLKRLNEVKLQLQQFPKMSQEELTLKREIMLTNNTYSSLLNNKLQLEISKAGLTSDLILLSDAIPPSRVGSHKLLTIIMGFFLGAFLASIIIIIKNTFNKTVESSDQLEEELRIPVQCIIPFSKKQKQIDKENQRHLKVVNSKPSNLPLILAKQEPNDITVESLRSLRVGLHFMPTTSNHKVIAVMGSLSNIGKSFVSLNLSQVFADAGKRTLLIDGDIRKGRLYNTLRQPKINGLSEYLEGSHGYEGLVRPIHENLFFISCGIYTTHPLKLFQSPRFQDLIKQAKDEFEQILIDTPPILPVTDSVLIASHCDTKLFIVSGRGGDKIGDVKQAIKKAHAHGIEIHSLVLNYRKSPLSHGHAYYRYGYDRYGY